MTEIDNLLFRCSRLSAIMTMPREKNAELSQTCITYLRELAREIKWGRRPEFQTKYTEKGKMVEERSLDLISIVSRTFYKKNTERIKNQWISGEPDTYLGKSITEATQGKDVKSSWDYRTFPFPSDKLEKSYYWQAMGYMALTGATQWDIAFCLVNTPSGFIDDEKRKWQWRMGVIDPDVDPAFREKCKQIEREMIYDMQEFLQDNPGYLLAHEEGEWVYDVPAVERVVEFPVMRNEEEIVAIYKQVEVCRNYMRKNLL